jgi:hypothetical protein
LKRRGGPASLASLVVLLLAACHGEFHFDEFADASDAAFESDARRTGCAIDADCPLPSLHCSPDTGACLACVSDSDCAGPTLLLNCDPLLHRCVECGSPRDCATGQTCEATTHRCVGTCRESVDCPAPSRGCDEGRRLCFACLVDQDCAGSASGPLCDKANALCVECTSNASCSSGAPQCDRTRGRCVECLSASDCAADAPTCDPTSWRCVRAN